MPQIRLIHWNAAEAEERVARLRAAGYDVTHEPLDGPAMLRALRENPPAAVVIDLTRLPSHGREVALALRSTKATRHVPLVFVEGEPEKVARLKELLPDAIYTTWSRIRAALKRATTNPPPVRVVPASALAAYSGTPLVKKLGIKANAVVALLDAPPGFEETLGELPPGATVRRQDGGRCDLAVWFVYSRKELEGRIHGLLDRAAGGGLWIAWPKKASGVVTDLTQALVREVGLAAGLVDFKISALDATWSGLRFSRRR